MKRFSTVRDTQKGSQSYMEKRKGRREIEVTRRRRGGIKSRECSLASNQFPMCSPQSRTLREVHSYIEKRRGKKEMEVTKRRGGVKRREINVASNRALSVFHSPEHPKRFTELHGEEKREEIDRDDQEEKRGSQKGRDQSSQESVP